MSLDADLATLRQIAKAADDDGRPWEWEHAYPQRVTRVGDVILIADCYEDPDMPSRFAEFIATFDPPTVLALLDEREWWTAVNKELLPYQERAVAAEAEIARLRQERDEYAERLAWHREERDAYMRGNLWVRRAAQELERAEAAEREVARLQEGLREAEEIIRRIAEGDMPPGGVTWLHGKSWRINLAREYCARALLAEDTPGKDGAA